MSLLDNPYVSGAVWLTAGAFVGYWLLRWKERSVRQALAIKEQGILEAARRQAENIAREGHLQASEQALKLREQAEQSLATKLTAATEAEKRLVQREALINQQLENMRADRKMADYIRQRHEITPNISALSPRYVLTSAISAYCCGTRGRNRSATERNRNTSEKSGNKRKKSRNAKRRRTRSE